MYILKYCSNSWFVLSICLSVYGWKAINSFVSIPNILFNSFINLTTNCGPLSKMTLSSNPYNFYPLSLNNLAKLFTIIFSIITIKYSVFKNLLYTTKIESWSLNTSNFVIKSTNIYCHSSFSTVFDLNYVTILIYLYFYEYLLLWDILYIIRNYLINTFQYKFDHVNLSSFSWDISQQNFYSYW